MFKVITLGWALPRRCLATAPKKFIALKDKPEPHNIQCDYIGPPDSISNLRPYVRHINANETSLQRKLRLRQIEIEQWNNEFWTRHNKRFQDERDDFIRLNNLSGPDDLSAERMSVFYKHFLDKSHRVHTLYNISWYIKNFELLILSFQVYIEKLWFRLNKKLVSK